MDWNSVKSLFKRDDKENEQAGEPAQAEPRKTTDPSPGRKKGPTPKRSEAESQNYHPLVPKDRKASRKAEKLRRRKRQDAEYAAMKSGDLTHMPAAERIPVRVYIRDYVDSRFNIAEYFLPAMLVILIISMIVMVTLPIAAMWLMAAMYVYMVVAVIDLFVLWHDLKKQLVDRFGASSVDKRMRSGMYASQRAMNIRRWRLPIPRLKKRADYAQWRQKNVKKGL